MTRISNFIVKYKKIVVTITLLLTVICVFAFFKVDINYNMTDYLPENANSTIALNTLSEEFGEAIPNCNVRVENVTISEGMNIKRQLSELDGVENVSWLDDVADIKIPLEAQDEDLIDDYYSDGNALFSVTIADGKEKDAIQRITDLLGENTMMSGTAVVLNKLNAMLINPIAKPFSISR